VLLTGTAGYFILSSIENYHDQQQRASVLGLARTISLNLRGESDLSDARRLYSFIQRLRVSDPRIIEATIVDSTGEITGDLDDSHVYSRTEDDDLLAVLRGAGKTCRTGRRGPDVFEATVPIYFPGSEAVLGALRLRYDMSSFQTIHQVARLRMLLAIGAITILLIAGLRYALVRSVVRPLSMFAAHAQAVSAGDLGARVPPQTTQELSLLRRSFNGMAESLQASLAALEGRRDILEVEIKERTAELSAARDHLERLNKALEERVEERTGQLLHAERLSAIGTLASGVAHEINNPLATILTCSEGLLRTLSHERPVSRGATDEKMESYLTTIRDEAKRCRCITAQLLDFSRRRIGSMAALDLRAVIRDAVVLAQPKAAAESKLLECRLQERPLPIEGEAGALKQLLLNLLLNALDASPHGALIGITASEERGNARICVEDRGRGLTPEEMARAFEPFFTTKTSGYGTGLGLAVCDMIVHQHHGEIRLESDGPGRGARAIIALPLAAAAVEHAI